MEEIKKITSVEQFIKEIQSLNKDILSWAKSF